MISIDDVKRFSKRCFVCGAPTKDMRLFYTIALEHNWGYAETRPVTFEKRRCKIFFCKKCFNDQAGDMFRFDVDRKLDIEYDDDGNPI